ncbi:hypothetical protein B0O99DRAFT_600880 [Bisporella sp. PMI_857]|nr:hypothetical protein B0O99DRAFT_600880 [Bisporella sp. PMI_857]
MPWSLPFFTCNPLSVYHDLTSLIAQIFCGFVLLSLVATTQAYTTFDTTCTVPSAPSNFVSSPDSRGTLDILWSCLFTIIAYTWTVQHLNIPEQREGSDPGFWGDIKWMLKRAWTGTKWMLATILAPELLLAKAWGDLGDAKYDLGKLKGLASQDGVPWTLTHCLFANMGGFVIRGYSDRPEAKEIQAKHLPPTVPRSDGMPRPRVSGPTEPEVTSIPCSNSKTGNTDTKNGTPEEEGNILVPGHNNVFHLTEPDIIELRTVKLLLKLPYVSIDEINDKSKGDAFVRKISIVQIIWVAILILTRVSRHLAVSRLEIGVLAFSVCAVIIYVLNWEKPRGVQTPVTVASYSGEIPNNTLKKLKMLKEPEHTSTGNLAGAVGRFKNPAFILGSRNPSSALGSPIPNYYTRNQKEVKCMG